MWRQTTLITLLLAVIYVFSTYRPSVDVKSDINGFVTEQSCIYSLQNNIIEVAEVINSISPSLILVTNRIAENSFCSIAGLRPFLV